MEQENKNIRSLWEYAGVRNLRFGLAAVSAFLLFSSVMLSMIYLRRGEEALSARIAPQVLRFHVLANSDSAADQNLKLEVKQMLIDTMYCDLKLEGSNDTRPANTKNAMLQYVRTHKEYLEEKAERFMGLRGFPYTATIRIENTYFPTKIYGDVVFPCGAYDAVRVLLGDGEGKNWWCVLYPPLCFTDNASAVVPDASKQELKYLLDDEDYHTLMKNRRIVFGDEEKTAIKKSDAQTVNGQARTSQATAPQATVHVRLRFLDLLTGRGEN